MLKLESIVKTYQTGNFYVAALRGINIEFRKNEFVSVLGQSGCGKTTLLNIVGGLDAYTSGDLIINGRSTKEFNSKDWDSYRNHSIGFVFQSYNLIPHQTVLSNVELALTLSGVSKSERKKRAIEALEKVGLGDQLHKKPNQMSGGQMQRVAIARALVNNPDILLADEPTGALDSQTSVQIMEILKEIAKDKLVIMVTHNPEIAQQYSTRIVKLLDGQIVDDSNPYTSEQQATAPLTKKEQKEKKLQAKKKSMSFLTALSLSFNNLLTKKGRTFMTSFAGSIGIIGIALILSLSNGVQAYIDKTEADTLSNYPLAIDRQSIDYTSMMKSHTDTLDDEIPDDGKAHTQSYIFDQLNSLKTATKTNDLKAFKKYIENHKDEFDKYTADISYSYNTTIYAYNFSDKNNIVKANPNTLSKDEGIDEFLKGNLDSTAAMYASATDSDMFTEIMMDKKLQNNYYNMLIGKMPQNKNEAVLILDKDGRISDYSLYTLGIRDRSELKTIMKNAEKNKKADYDTYEYSDFMGLKFKVLATSDLYQKNEQGFYDNKSEDTAYMKETLEDALEIEVVGVAKYTEDAASVTAMFGGMIGYTPELSKYIMDRNNNSAVVKAQQDNEKIDIFTGFEFKTDEDIEREIKSFDISKVSPQYQPFFAGLKGDELTAAIKSYVTMTTPKTTYADNLDTLGVASVDDPEKINIYCKDFESKESLTALIDDYNKQVGSEKSISYTDYIGLMMSSITTIISAISYILMAFVAISLIVSSIMIGIITYISVLERTKEIGILRAIGASKKDISRVFNAETMIVGFVAGIIGIAVTLILIVPINIIIKAVADIGGMAVLPWAGAIVLIVISVVLTAIAGLIPSSVAAKKNPVEALRTE